MTLTQCSFTLWLLFSNINSQHRIVTPSYAIHQLNIKHLDRLCSSVTAFFRYWNVELGDSTETWAKFWFFHCVYRWFDKRTVTATVQIIDQSVYDVAIKWNGTKPTNNGWWFVWWSCVIGDNTDLETWKKNSVFIELLLLST